MIRRIARITAAELMKLVLHPFFYFSILVLVVLVPVWAILKAGAGGPETIWRTTHSLELFVYGFQPGLKIATFLVLIFTSMLFAGEYDRGTIKILLTRPITRTDFFLAKALTAGLLMTFFTGLVFYLSLVVGFLGGEMGPVWESETYNVQVNYADIVDHASTAVGLVLLPTIAAAMMGLLVSTMTESSAYAVATTLVIYLLLWFGVAFLRPESARYLFTFYDGYALDNLGEFTRGTSAFWKHRIEEWWQPLWAPIASILIFAGAAYARFLSRDITA